MALPPTGRTTSLSGSARLSLSVGKTNVQQSPSGRHPLKHDWSISYVHRPPGAKVEYEKEIRKVATFGSIESFLNLYSHLVPPNELPPVTDVLVFLSRIGRPGVWEEMRDGGRFTIRLAHPVTPILFESLLLALLGDQFEESDAVVGTVLSVRHGEDILSLWVEEEGESVRNGSLKEKIISLLGLPSNTICEYRSNKALLDAASNLKTYSTGTNGVTGGGDENGDTPAHGTHHGSRGNHRNNHRDRDSNRDRVDRDPTMGDSERPERIPNSGSATTTRGPWGSGNSGAIGSGIIGSGGTSYRSERTSGFRENREAHNSSSSNSIGIGNIGGVGNGGEQQGGVGSRTWENRNGGSGSGGWGSRRTVGTAEQ